MIMLAAGLIMLLQAPFAQGARLPPVGAKDQDSGIKWSARMTPERKSLGGLLDEGCKIVAANDAGDEEILFLVKDNRNLMYKLLPPTPGANQNALTPRCWSIVRSDRII